MVRPVLQQQRSDRFEIGRGDQRETVWLENAPEFQQRLQNFMGVEMLKAVRSPSGVESTGGSTAGSISRRTSCQPLCRNV
jgi:hypothetical protein